MTDCLLVALLGLLLFCCLPDPSCAAFSSSVEGVRCSANHAFATTQLAMSGRQDQVKDFMTKPCFSVTPEMSLDDAAKFLVGKKIAGAPVVDREGGKVVGVISQFDFLCKEAGAVALDLASPTYRQDVKKIMSNKVQTSMTPNPITVVETSTMQASASIMIKNKLNRLPVVDSEGKLVGLLSSSDVMRHLVSDM
eukprot:scaffold27788_cov31-Attheya_sp.AAC.1